MPPSQFDPLLRDDLRSPLEQRDPSAEIELARRYNHPRPRADPARARVPNRGDPYAKYDPRLLAMLWGVAGNTEALRALAALHGFVLPDPLPDPIWPCLPEGLLVLLWDLGRDGPAIQELWTRQGILPAGPYQETPDHVLGFLAWFRDDAAALQELMYRHHEVRVSDASQERVEVFLHVVPRWDYLNRPNFRPLLLRSIRNWQLTQGRRTRDVLSLGETSEDEEQNAGADLLAPPPEAATADRDELERTPVHLRAIYRIRNKSEDSPQQLTSAERDYLARRNLGNALDGLSEEEQQRLLTLEGERIARWMAENPRPSGKRIRTILPWYNDSQSSKGARSWRLKDMADRLDRQLGVSLPGSPPDIEDEAARLQSAVDDLVQRSSTEARQPGTVPLFDELTACWSRLHQWLMSQRWEHVSNQPRRDEARGESARLVAAFLQEFPVLRKLSACSRWTDFLLAASPPPSVAPVLANLRRWLDEGHWLSSFGSEHRQRSATFAGSLLAVLPHQAGNHDRAPELLLYWLGLTQQAGAPPDVWCELGDLWQMTHEAPPNSLGCWAPQIVQLIDLALGNKHALLAEQARKLAGQVAPSAAFGPQRAFQMRLDRLARIAQHGVGPSPVAGG